MIELDQVTKTYDRKNVVDSVTLSVAKGDLCVLIGPSGSGKSTTLKMINRLIPLSSGAIRIEGQDIASVRAEELRRRIGYAIQSIGLFPHWTVEQNIAVVPRLLKWSSSQVRQRVEELLELFHLAPSEFRHKYPHQLSGGQAQRVGVARALAADPEVLLMDEPFGALDPITRDSLQEEMRRVHEETGKTIVFVTHDMDEALKLASRIAIMDEGRLVQVGTPREILNNPANDFVLNFVGQSDLGLKMLACESVETRLEPAPSALRNDPLESIRNHFGTSDHLWLLSPEGQIEGLLTEAPAADDDLARSLRPLGRESHATPDMSLKEALSHMVWRKTDWLPVVDAEGRLTGEVGLSNVMERP